MSKKHFTTQEEIKKAIDLYNNEMLSCTQIGKIFGCAQSVVSKTLKENGVNVTNRQNEVKFSTEDCIKAYCQDKLSLTQIAHNFGTSRWAVSKRLKAANIDVVNYHNKAKFNENVFDVIDTEEKAYWLGFIYADGYISSKSSKKRKMDYRFELSLSEKDINHLNKFNKFMEYEGDNVKTGNVKLGDKEFKRCRWGVGNKHLWETLNAYGCTPQKSLTLKFPDKSIFKEESLIIPFIRGYFDGDGSVSIAHITSNPSPCLCAHVLGTKEFLTPIADLFFEGHLSLHKNQVTWQYGLSRKQAYIFLTIIYYKATIFLDRKIQKFKEWKNCRPQVKAWGLLEGKIGEDWDVNPELTFYGNM